MINRIDLYGLFTDVLIQDNPYRGSKFSRMCNGYFGHRSPYITMQTYHTVDHFTILMRQRESIDEDWPPTCKLVIFKNV